MAITFTLSGGLDSLQEHMADRIRAAENQERTATRLRDKRYHHARAIGLREALEYLDVTIRSADPEPTKVPEPVELRQSGRIIREIEQRVAAERARAQADADRRAAETLAGYEDGIEGDVLQ